MSSSDGRRPETAKAIMQALRRVISGKPRHHTNVERAKRGKLRLTVSSVADEAGVSRSLIGSKNCVYKEEREAVLEAMGKGGNTGKKQPSSADLVMNLRRDKRELDTHVRVLATRLHDAFLEKLELQKEYRKLEGELADTREALRRATSRVKERT
jgi:hypothetical protein